MVAQLGMGTVPTLSLTHPVSMCISSLHHKLISLLGTDTPKHPILLVIPWLHLHNPCILWSRLEITKWSEYSIQHCLQYPCAFLSSTSTKSPYFNISIHFPEEYHKFRDMFSKASSQQPTSSSPIQLSHQSASRNHVLMHLELPSVPHQGKALEEYVQETLQQGYIAPSTLSAVFFFMEKKGDGLWLCIDYRGLKQIILPTGTEYLYPLPLVPSALDQLRSVCIFTKLHLCSAYNLIHIHAWDDWKTAFSTSSGHYQYQVMLEGLFCAPSVFQHLMGWVIMGTSIICWVIW